MLKHQIKRSRIAVISLALMVGLTLGTRLARATTIGFPFNLVNILLPSDIVFVAGSSSDGANFSIGPDSSNNGLVRSGAQVGSMGSLANATATASTLANLLKTDASATAEARPGCSRIPLHPSSSASGS